MAVNSVSSSSSSGAYANQMEQLIDSYMKTRKPEVDALNTKKTTLENKRLYFTRLKSKISDMTSSLDKFFRLDKDKKFDSAFKTTADKLLTARKVTSSDESYVKASADNTSVIGTSSIRVNQLASNDVFIGKQSYNAIDSGIAAGETTYNVKVLNKDYKDGDPIENKYKNIAVKVGFDGTETNELAMKKISNAFNAKSDLNFSVSFMKDTSLTGRLTLTAKNTGEDNKLDLSFFTAPESTNTGVNDLLGLSNLNSDRTSIDTDKKQASFKVANASDLNSKLNVNGVDVVRSTNTVNDMLPGVTLNLLKVHAETDKDVNLSTVLDGSKIADNIKEAMNSYNDIVKHLNSDKTMSRTDSSVSGLKTQLRSIAYAQIEPKEGTPTDEETAKSTPKNITALGFKMNKEGLLTLDDPSKLEAIIKADGGTERLSHFLNSEDGFFSKIHSVVNGLNERDGVLDVRRKSIDQQLEANKKRTDALENRIDNAAYNLRKEYTQMLKLFNKSNSQYNSMMNMFNSYSYS